MDSSQPTRFPVTHKSVSLDIKGNKTDIVICKYDDKFLVSMITLPPWLKKYLVLTTKVPQVIVTQIGCMGTILHARKEESVSTEPTFSVTVIFGKRDEPWLLACGRQLIEHISCSGSSRPLVLSLGLKDHSPGTLKAITVAVIENCLW